MLGLLGLLGLVSAGLMLDAVLDRPSGRGAGPDDDAQPDDDVAGAYGDSSGGGSMFDWLEPDRGQDAGTDGGETTGNEGPDSDDLTDDPDPAVTLTGDDDDDILAGLGGDDTLAGLDGVDQLVGRGGDDLLDAGAGDDHAFGGGGNDTLDGGAGNDALQGEADNDLLSGGGGADMLAGQGGEDTLDGGAGDDELQGGEGDDWLTGAGGDDWLNGAAGDDVMVGGAGQDTLDGGDGQDRLVGVNAGADPSSDRSLDLGADQDVASRDGDFLNGGAGNDQLIIGANDHATGGEGADRFVLGDWIAAGGFAHIHDYDPSEDQIFLVYDTNSHPDPDLLLVRDDQSDDVIVFLDGTPLALVQNGAGLSHSDIRLSPDGQSYLASLHGSGAT
jgi:Ca2+-binding RTX toxin-like protein